MRRFRAAGGLAVLAAVAIVLLWRGGPGSSQAPEAAQLVLIPPLAEPAPPASPADLPAAAAPAFAAAPVEIAAAPPAQSGTGTAPPVDALPPLPIREISARQAHVVPENDPPLPPRPIDIRGAGAPGRAAVAAAFPATAPRAVPGPGQSGRIPIPQLVGPAQASGATALLVGGQALRLFGVRPPTAGDRCTASSGLTIGKPPACADKAQGVLAARLSRDGKVFCRFPPAKAAGAAICLDGEGVDLGGLLVAEGLALADPAQGSDYVGAEQVARSQKRGLWLFR